jgi:PAS domain S-box-containing protein
LFGKTSEELIGHKWHPIVVQEDLPYILEKLETLSPSCPVVTIENRIISAHGVIKWMQFVNRAFFDLDDNLIEIQSVGRDISERKQTEFELQVAHRRLNLALECSGIGVWDADLIHDTVWHTLEHDKIFGYEALQPNWSVLSALQHVIPEDREVFIKSGDDAYHTGNLSFTGRVIHRSNASLDSCQSACYLQQRTASALDRYSFRYYTAKEY